MTDRPFTLSRTEQTLTVAISPRRGRDRLLSVLGWGLTVLTVVGGILLFAYPVTRWVALLALCVGIFGGQVLRNTRRDRPFRLISDPYRTHLIWRFWGIDHHVEFQTRNWRTITPTDEAIEITITPDHRPPFALPTKQYYIAQGLTQEERLQLATTTQQALQEFQTSPLPEQRLAPRRPRPEQTNVQIQQTRDRLAITIPAQKLRQYHYLVTLNCTGVLSLLVLWGITQTLWDRPWLPWLLAAATTTVLVNTALKLAIALWGQAQLSLDRDRFYRSWSLWGLRRRVNRSTHSLAAATLPKTNVYGRPSYTCTLKQDRQVYTFGTYLSADEQEWLAGELSHFLNHLNQSIGGGEG